MRGFHASDSAILQPTQNHHVLYGIMFLSGPIGCFTLIKMMLHFDVTSFSLSRHKLVNERESASRLARVIQYKTLQGKPVQG